MKLSELLNVLRTLDTDTKITEGEIVQYFKKAEELIDMSLEPKYQECDRCHERKPDVRHRTDGYANDVHNDHEAMHTACDDCDLDNNMDI